MFNLRISGIIAAAAFVLSFLIGLLSSTSMPMLIIRPLVFAALFFIITGLIYYLVNQFLPELLEGNEITEDKALRPGSRIDITEGDSASFPPPGDQAGLGAQADNSEDGLGNISDLLGKYTASPAPGGGTPEETGGTPAGLDQNEQTEYNKTGGSENATSPAKPVVPSGTAAEISDSVDFLPDLDSMAGAFLSQITGEESDTTEYSVSTPSPRPSSSNKTPEWAGDFNAKELAAGLRTVLKKEKEG